jgi:hypothetical protein
MTKKKLVPRNPLVVKAKFKKAGLIEKTKKAKNKKSRAGSKKEIKAYKEFIKELVGKGELKDTMVLDWHTCYDRW